MLVVGAGPAGLMAAIAAGRAGEPATVLERMPHPGLKLLAAGGGRCNLTNTASTADFIAAFGRQGRFMAPALEAMDSAGLREFLAGLGVKTYAEGELVYPVGNSSRVVHSALLRECRGLGVRILTSCRATELLIADGRVAGVRADGRELPARCVVLAAGGEGYPELGGAGGGYELARQAGHTILPPTPALVGLVTKEDWPRQCAGISIADARVWIDLRSRPGAKPPMRAAAHGRSRAGWRGDIIFTHRGLSGPAILNASGDVAELLSAGPVPIMLDLTPNLPRETWLKMLATSHHSEGSKTVASLLERHLPARLARQLCSRCGAGPSTRLAELPSFARRDLAEAVTAARLTVTATEGFAKAMVTRGGVALREVDARTLQSLLAGGLHFAGELLDLDGPTGGYNLQWAFSSGWLAGKVAGL
jgi:hypothetical protein